MSRVRAKTKVFVDNVLREEGAVFEYNGPENSNLEPVDQDGKPIEKPAKTVGAPNPASHAASPPAPKHDNDEDEEKRFAKRK